MSKMAGKLGGQSKQPGDSKAEASAGRSTAARGEAVAFTLAAGSIGLAISLLEQERAEASTNPGHENSVDQSVTDSVAVSEGTSGGDHLATIDAGDGNGPHGAGSASISATAYDGGAGDPAVNLEPIQAAAPAPAQEGASDAASGPTQQHQVAMSSANPTHEISTHNTAGVTVNVPQHAEPSTSNSPSAPHQADAAENISHNLPSVTDGATLPEHSTGAESPIENVVDTVIPGVTAPVEGVLGNVGEVVAGVGGVVDNVLGTVGEVVSGVGGVVDNVLGTVGDALSGVGDLVGGLLGGDGKGVLAGVGSTVENVVGTVGDVLSGVGGLVGGLLGGDGKGSLAHAGSTVDHALDSAGDTVSGLGDAVGDLLGGGGKGVLSEVGSTVDDLLGTVGNTVSGIGGLVGGLLGGIASSAADSSHSAQNVAVSAPNMFEAANEALQFSDGLFALLTPTLSFLGQSAFTPNDPVDIANHHGTTLHGQTWEG